MKNRTFYLYTGIVLSILVFSFFIGYAIYSHWKSIGINDEQGYNSINAVIALLSLGFNIVTVIFVYATYQTSNKQLLDSNKNTEYNRALDNIYKQMEYTKQFFAPKYEPYSYLKENMESDENLYRNINKIKRFLMEFVEDIELYLLIIGKDSLAWEEKSFLLNVVFKNYNEVIKSLYLKLYTIKVVFSGEDIYDRMSKFFLDYYKTKQMNNDPSFSILSESEQESVVKELKKEVMANNFFNLSIILKKLDWVKTVENEYQIRRNNVMYFNKANN